MARAKMACPFSGGRCVECALYRGRHYHLCFSKHYNESLQTLEGLWNQRRANKELQRQGNSKESSDGKFGMPDSIPKCSSWISDVEDLPERRDV